MISALFWAGSWKTTCRTNTTHPNSPIAIAGTAGYLIQGWRVPDLPAPSLGYVYLPALALVVMTSMLAAPVGARVAHRLPIKQLRRLFALLLYVFAARMLAGVW